MDIKHIIKLCLPYYVTNKIIQNNIRRESMLRKNLRVNDFVQDYNDFVAKGVNIEFNNICKYKTIISVQGFGYSGSGAVVDLLREYPCCQVFGGVDREGSITDRSMVFEEVDFARLYGGLFDIEHYIDSNNVFQNNGVLNNFARLVGNSKIYKCSDEIKNYFLKFFDSLVDFNIKMSWQAYNPHLNFNFHNPNIFYLKNYTVSEYRQLCRSLIYSLFNSLHSKGKKCLVLDQFFSDVEFNIEKNKEYIPNLKTIVVYRDPRDVYTFAKKNNVEWIAHDNVENYVRWNKIFYKCFSLTDNNYLAIRFEDLVNEYDKTVSKIQDYLGIHDHIYAKQNFDPAISKQNVGIWKTSDIDNDDYEVIKENFPNYCYL